MASLRVLAFDHEGRPVQFDTWLDDLQMYLLSDSKDSVSLFDHTSGAATAPPTTADSATRQQWLTSNAAARLAIRNNLPLAECAHFGQHRTAQALYDAVVARYSSPATAALGRLLLPYLFPELSAFATVEDLISHLRTSDAHYRTTVPTEFLDRNQPPMFITLYFIVTRLPDSLRSVRDHFLSLDPTSLTVDLLEQHLLAAETSAVATSLLLRTSGLLLVVRIAAAARARVAGVVEVAAVVVEVVAGVVVGAAVEVVEAVEVVAAVGLVAGVGALVAAVEAAVVVAAVEAVGLEAVRLDLGMDALDVASGSNGSVGARPSRPSSSTWGKLHIQHRCFSRLDDAWRAEFGDDVELPRRADLLRSRIAIFDLDFHAFLSAMYVLSVSAEGDCYQCVPPNPGIAAAALGASESGTLPGTAPAQALHTFTLDSGASRCFFRDSTTLTPLLAPIPVRLADPSGGPVVARSSTVLPCPAVPSGSLSGLHLPSFSTNLVSTAALQDAMVTTTTPKGQRGSICTCTRTGRHLATFTRRLGSSLYTFATEPSQVAASAQVSASGQVAASCSCRLLSHQTLLWHHRLGHPSLPRLRGMHSRLLVSGLPRSLPPLPPSPAPPCLPCVEGRQQAAPHSSSFPLTTAPLQTLHMDVWGPARVSGQGREHYFLLVVDDYTRYTTVFPLRSKGEVVDVLIPWIRTVRLQLRERFGQDLSFLRLHSDRGGKFSSNLLRDLCRGEGILQSFTLPDSPQQNGIAERRIGLVMEVARTSMIHAASPHFLWPFAVRYTAHQLNFWPRVSLPETSPTLRWTGEVGDASVFRVWGSRAFVRDTSMDKLSARAIPCVFLGFVPDAPGWQFYHPTSRRVLPSQDITFDESVPFYCLFPYRSAPPPPLPLFLAPGPPPVDPLPPQGLAPSGVFQVDPLLGTAPVEVAVGSGAAPGTGSGGAASEGEEPGDAGSEGAGSGGAEPGGEEPGGAEPEGVEPGGAESEGAESGGAEPRCAASSGGPAGASPRLSPQQLREWLVRRARLQSGAPRAGGAGVTAGAGGTGGTAATGPRGARTRGVGAARTCGVGGAGAGDPTEPGAAGAGRSCAGGACTGDAGARGAGAGGTGVGGARAARAGAVDPGAGSADCTATALVAESASVSPPSVGGECALGMVVLEDRQEDFECLAAAVPRLASMLLAPEQDPDAPDIPTPCSYAEAITGPYSSQWQAAMDAEMASWKSTGTYVDKVPPPGANIVDGIWIFRVKRPPSSPPAFKVRYVARGFSQRQGVDYFQTFSPTPKMTTHRVLLHVAAQRDYELHSLDFSIAFLLGSLHEEIWLRRPPGFT
ncbi:unnamed protein product [Closterium sp. NIES-53]